MSTLTIRFAPDMPPASVEVVSSEFKTLARVMLDAGREAKVSDAPNDSFLRVHLASGRMVTLTEDRGKLDRNVSRAALAAAEGILLKPHEKTISKGGVIIRTRRPDRYGVPPEDVSAVESVALGNGITARVLDPADRPVKGKLDKLREKAIWELNNNNFLPPARLEIEHPGGLFYAILPGNTRTVSVRPQRLPMSENILVSVRLATTQPIADSILNYLAQGDLHSAESMVPWVQDAHEMLRGKFDDPYAAAVGAYLLLTMRRCSLLHDWVKNLADHFDFLPDGCVLWAWQQIYESPSSEGLISEYLLKAASRPVPGMPIGVPVYSQGLRLLLDGLSMIPNDKKAQEVSSNLRNSCGAVLWDSPVTAGSKLVRLPSAPSYPISYDVRFMADA
jgi:hypothetical protein